MTEIIELLNFSGSHISCSTLCFDQVQELSYSDDERISQGDAFFTLPWEIGFQEQNGELKACFGDVLDGLDPNAEDTVKFTELAEYIVRITDESVLRHIFLGFFGEILKKLTSSDDIVPRERDWYIILPYQWPAEHRSQIREVLKHFNQVRLRGFLSDVICAIAYYLSGESNNARLPLVLKETPKVTLFLFDFRLKYLKLWWIEATDEKKAIRFLIKELRVFPQNLQDNNKAFASEIHRWIASVVEQSPGSVLIQGFGGSSVQQKAIAEELTLRLNNLFKNLGKPDSMEETEGDSLVYSFDSEIDVVQEGGAIFINWLLHPAQVPTQLIFEYNFRFGIQIDAEQIYEITPHDFTPPFEVAKAFTVTGQIQPFIVNFYGGLSDKVNSSVRLASILINPTADAIRTQRFEFIASVKFTDRTQGRFSVIVPHGANKSKDFKVPVLME